MNNSYVDAILEGKAVREVIGQAVKESEPIGFYGDSGQLLDDMQKFAAKRGFKLAFKGKRNSSSKSTFCSIFFKDEIDSRRESQQMAEKFIEELKAHYNFKPGKTIRDSRLFFKETDKNFFGNTYEGYFYIGSFQIVSDYFLGNNHNIQNADVREYVATARRKIQDNLNRLNFIKKAEVDLTRKDSNKVDARAWNRTYARLTFTGIQLVEWYRENYDEDIFNSYASEEAFIKFLNENYGADAFDKLKEAFLVPTKECVNIAFKYSDIKFKFKGVKLGYVRTNSEDWVELYFDAEMEK